MTNISGTSFADYSFPVLDTSGNTTDGLPVQRNLNHSMVAKIVTPRLQIFIRVEGSLDGTNWFNLDTSGNTGDGSGNSTGWSRGSGTYAFTFANKKIRYIRGKYCSGGTGGTVPKLYWTYSGWK